VTDSPPPEYALLLDAIAPRAASRANYRDWDGAQWDLALRAAEWHRLSPILFRHLDARGRAPAATLGTLEQAYLANAARNLFIGESLRRVLEALAGAAVPAMLLKGAALIESVYPDPALREMLDLDILVPAGELDAANAALAAIGYRGIASTGDELHTRAETRVAHHHDPALVADDELTAVELHHHIAMSHERAHFDISGLWERARPSPGGPAHLLPSAEDLLLHVCLHFTRNRLGGSYRRRATGGALSQLCDIAWIIDREVLDWDALVDAVRAYRLDARVFLPLFAARELGIPVPDPALEALRPPGFDPRLGRRLVALRVLRAGRHLPVRSLRFMVAPGREVLARGWNAEPGGSLSLARAYVRRAAAQAALARSALKRPWAVVQDYRLNGQIHALERRD
jgi:Uncharacterised nucleotidyltransferase